VRTASTIKLAVMAALFDAIARGELQWSERLTSPMPRRWPLGRD